MQELQNTISSKCQYLDNQSLIDVSEVFTVIVAKLLNEGKFEELYNFYREYNLSPEIMKENIDILLTSNSKTNSLHSVSKNSLTKFSKYYQQKSEKKVSKKAKAVEDRQEESAAEEEEMEEAASEEEELAMILMDN